MLLRWVGEDQKRSARQRQQIELETSGLLIATRPATPAKLRVRVGDALIA
jgi:hypothetical protein